VSANADAMQEISFSQPSWTKVMNYTMSQATGDNAYKGELLNFPAVQENVKWIGINILNSYNSTSGYTGISEIKLYKSEVLSGTNPTVKKKLAEVYRVNNQLFLKNNSDCDLNFELYSIQGKMLYHQILPAFASIQLTNLIKQGIYILKVSDSNTKQVFKVQM
jgi:hypothetical protein